MKSKSRISPDQARDILTSNNSLENFHIYGDFDISDFGRYVNKIIINNCTIENFNAQNVDFVSDIELIDTLFLNASFATSFFKNGLLIENCIFKNNVDFQDGGYNKVNKSIEFINNTFYGFVNFIDCVFNGPVVLKYNNFNKGSNLLGNKNKSYCTVFDFEPELYKNKGEIDLDGEGIIKITSLIY